jgi:hypothetical protein
LASFNLCRIAPDGYAHAAALDEIADTLRHGIETLGVPVHLRHNTLGHSGVNLILGAHLLEESQARALPPATIVYNLEQIEAGSGWLRPGLVTALTRCAVWDYSEGNLQRIRALTGNTRLRHVPVGYVPQLTRIVAAEPQDIDVLFYGSLNDRRQRVLAGLRAVGLEVAAVFGVYGEARDRLIARAKAVLNLHYYDARVLEVVRVSYLLANRKAVVAEYHADTEIYPDLRDALYLVPYNGLVDACRELITSVTRRRHYENMGFRRMQARPAAAILRPAVNAALAADTLGRGSGVF